MADTLTMAREALALNAELDCTVPVAERLAKTRAAIAAIDAQQAATVGAHWELPDEIRVPLHKLWADAGYLVGRARSGDVDLAVHRIKALCDEVERAIRALATPPAVQAQDAARYQRLRLMARYDDATQTVTFPGLRLGAGSGLPDMLDAGLDGAAARGGE